MTFAPSSTFDNKVKSYIKTIQTSETTPNWQAIVQSLLRLRQLFENSVSSDDLNTLIYHTKALSLPLKKCILSARTQISDAAIQLSKAMFHKIGTSEEVPITELTTLLVPAVVTILGRANLRSREIALTFLNSLLKTTPHSSIIPLICSSVTSKNALIRPLGSKLLRNMITLLPVSVLRERMHMIEATLQKALTEPQTTIQADAKAGVVEYALKIPERCDGSLGVFPPSLRRVIDSSKLKKENSVCLLNTNTHITNRPEIRCNTMPTRGVVINHRLPNYSNLKPKIKTFFSSQDSLLKSPPKSSFCKVSPKSKTSKVAYSPLKTKEVLCSQFRDSSELSGDTLVTETRSVANDHCSSKPLAASTTFKTSNFEMSGINESRTTPESFNMTTSFSSKNASDLIRPNPEPLHEIPKWAPKSRFLSSLLGSNSNDTDGNDSANGKPTLRKAYSGTLPTELETFASLLSLKSPLKKPPVFSQQVQTYYTMDPQTHSGRHESAFDSVLDSSKKLQDVSFLDTNRVQHPVSIVANSVRFPTPQSLPRLPICSSPEPNLEKHFDFDTPMKNLKREMSPLYPPSVKKVTLDLTRVDSKLLEMNSKTDSLKRPLEDSSLVAGQASSKRQHLDVLPEVSNVLEPNTPSSLLDRTLGQNVDVSDSFSAFADGFPVWDSEVEDFMALSASELMSFSSVDSDYD